MLYQNETQTQPVVRAEPSSASTALRIDPATKTDRDLPLAPFSDRSRELSDLDYGELMLPLVPPGVELKRRDRKTGKLIPYVADGKSPGNWNGEEWFNLLNWPNKRTVPAAVDIWRYWPAETGLGLQTGKLIGFDIDIKVDPHSQNADDVLARRLIGEIRASLVGGLGVPDERLPMRRRSNSTSIMIFARTDDHIKPETVTFVAGGRKYEIELRATGQQVVVSGYHKSGVVQTNNLADWPFDRLPLVNREQIDVLLRDFKFRGEALGFVTDRVGLSRFVDLDRPRDPIMRAVMERRNDWLPDVLGLTCDVPDGEFRVTQDELARDLVEDLAIGPDIIHDFGTRRTHDPISLICEFGNIDDGGEIAFGGSPEYETDDGVVFNVVNTVFDTVRRPTPQEAATWLCRRLGDPDCLPYVGPTDWKTASAEVARSMCLEVEALRLAPFFDFLDWSVFGMNPPELWTEDELESSAALIAALRIVDPKKHQALVETLNNRPTDAVSAETVEAVAKKEQTAQIERQKHAQRASLSGIAVISGPINAHSIPLREYVIEPRLPRGDVVQLVGEPGISKSSFALRDAVIVATGREDILRGPGLVNAERLHRSGPVIVYNAEDRADEMHRRLRTVQAHYGIVGAHHPIILWSGVDGTTLKILKRGTEKNSVLERAPDADFLEKMIAQHKPALVCLDPQVSLMAGAQENSNDDINALFQELANIASRRSTCIQVIHHTAKSTRDDAGDMGAGRGGFAAAGKARAVYTLVNVTGKNDQEKQWGVSPADNLIRLDNAKMSHAARPRLPVVFRRLNVSVGNGQGLTAETAAALYPQSPREALEATGDFAPVLDVVNLHDLIQPAQRSPVDSEVARKIAAAVDIVMGDLDEIPLSEIIDTVGARLRDEGVTDAKSRQKLSGMVTNALLGNGACSERDGQNVRIRAAKMKAGRASPWTFTRTIEGVDHA